jgi:chromosome segregation ATPase
MPKLRFAMLLLMAPAALCQTPAKAPDTLQSLLDEVHRLRQDIEAMTVASQRVQIALYTLQMQDAAVARAAARVDEARKRCMQPEENREHFASEARRVEAILAAGPPDAFTKGNQQELDGYKQELDAASARVQSCQAAESQAQGELRNEQAKLSELQDRIARLDTALAKLGVDGK